MPLQWKQEEVWLPPKDRGFLSAQDLIFPSAEIQNLAYTDTFPSRSPKGLWIQKSENQKTDPKIKQFTLEPQHKPRNVQNLALPWVTNTFGNLSYTVCSAVSFLLRIHQERVLIPYSFPSLPLISLLTRKRKMKH